MVYSVCSVCAFISHLNRAILPASGGLFLSDRLHFTHVLSHTDWFFWLGPQSSQLCSEFYGIAYCSLHHDVCCFFLMPLVRLCECSSKPIDVRMQACSRPWYYFVLTSCLVPLPPPSPSCLHGAACAVFTLCLTLLELSCSVLWRRVLCPCPQLYHPVIFFVFYFSNLSWLHWHVPFSEFSFCLIAAFSDGDRVCFL